MRSLLFRILLFLVGAQSCCARARRALLLLALLPLAAVAQSVRWDPPGGQLGFNQVSQIALVFEDCEPDGDPRIPTVDGLQFGRPSQSSQTSIVNFKVSRTFSLVFPVRPSKRAPIAIPAFDIQTDKGTLKVPAARFTVGDAPVGSSGLAVDDVASATLEIPQKSIWAGEVFPVTYTLNVVRRYFHSLGSNVEWAPSPAVADDWTKPDPTEATVQGERRVISVQTTRATIKQAGTFTLKPASQMINLMVGSSGFGFFAQPNVEQRQLDTKPVDVAVKPLPAPPRDFTGAVGQFRFVSKVVPVAAAVGEPITWTLELAGSGNWPDIAGLPQREVSNDFQIVQPKSKRTIKDGTLFEGTLSEDVVLVPTRAGTYRLPPVSFTYFDPASGSYKTVASEPVTLTIAPGAAAVVPPASSGAPVQFPLAPPSASTAVNNPTPTAPVPPENLPRDPLLDSASGFRPMPKAKLTWIGVIAAMLPPLIAWLLLAARRSRERDPQRRRREARAALTATIEQLRQSRDAAPPELLVAWQRHAATLWNIPHAAPGVALVKDSVARISPAQADTWAALWTDTDRALHSRDNALPGDWASRAEQAARTTVVPGWNALSLFAGRNLFPFLVALALLALPVGTAAAEAGADAYNRGDFAAAEKAWAEGVASKPADWSARHNLGLALAQQERWAEATAHWTSGFLLNSRSDLTRWDLSLGLQRSGLAQPTLVELSRGEGPFRLARLATPGEWQLILIAAAALLALGIIVLLLQAYGRFPRWGGPLALGGTVVAVVLAGAATFSLHTYGPLSDPHAVFVWEATTLYSIPTEADTAQKTSPLSAGSLATVEKTFLGWTKLTFPGGQSGWVRSETLVGLYQ